MNAIPAQWCNRSNILVLLILILLTSYLDTCDGSLADNQRVTHNDDPTLPEINIPQGILRGVNMVTHHSRKVFGFAGVPYAQPPIGNLRFKAPEPAGAWKGTLDANRITDPILCPQIEHDGIFEGEEDCLYLNVYTPKLPSTGNSTLMPVMMYIVGGNFQTEQNLPMRYGPDFLLDKDVVLVIPNFRVAALGYLSTDDEVSPGNYGLKDVVQALKWTKDNIQYFGGDANRVTLFGGSSGGMSVHLLALSKLTHGLIHKIIIQSGSALGPRFHVPRHIYANRAFQLGKFVGCPTDTSQRLVDCLRHINVSQIIRADSQFLEWAIYPRTVWAPTCEPDVEGALLTDTPANLIAYGKMPDLPWMAVVTWDEGLFNTIAFYENTKLLEDVLNDTHATLPLIMDYRHTVVNETAFTSALVSYYLNDLTAHKSSILANLTHLIGDALFYYPTYKAFQKQLRFAKSPQYLAALKYRGSFSKSYSLSGGSTKYSGVLHGDEIIYLYPYHGFDFGPPGSAFNEDDWKMVDIMVEMWTSFATNGTPTTTKSNTTWEPYTLRNNYLLIGDGPDTKLKMQHDLYIERMRFWNKLTAAYSNANKNSLQILSIAVCICLVTCLGFFGSTICNHEHDSLA